MQISVVIPTYNRKVRLLSLLENLNCSKYPVAEVIVVDSGNDTLIPTECATFPNLHILVIKSPASVCLQRNTGVKAAKGDWIFICDDDIELPHDYLAKLAAHIHKHTEAGAVSGIVLENVNGVWKGDFEISSAKELVVKYIFKLGIWGSITCKRDNKLVSYITRYFSETGNHIAKSGWPVITNFTDPYFIVPVYGLGASLIRKSWMELSPYDEVLDKHGIGDNYGVAMGFPLGIHIVNDAYAYHHKEKGNRLQQPLQYYRRAMALDYFMMTKANLQHTGKQWLLWSLFGNALLYVFNGNRTMIIASVKTFLHILVGKNPYKTTHR